MAIEKIKPLYLRKTQAEEMATNHLGIA